MFGGANPDWNERRHSRKAYLGRARRRSDAVVADRDHGAIVKKCNEHEKNDRQEKVVGPLLATPLVLGGLKCKKSDEEEEDKLQGRCNPIGQEILHSGSSHHFWTDV